MMTYILLTVTFLAITHFIYEAILAPSMRLKARFDLFRLRDELRSLKINHGEILDNKHFTYLHDSINTAINMIPRFELMTISIMITELKKDRELGRKLNERLRVMDDCTIPDVIMIRKKITDIALRAYFINSGMWFYYLLPIALTLGLYKALKEKIKSIISLPTSVLEKIAPKYISPEMLS
jgi:hypothetical protein